MLENGLVKCNCKKKSCLRHGKCAECIEFHKTNKREPYCKRKNAIRVVLDNVLKK
jgi:hypothetical protein